MPTLIDFSFVWFNCTKFGFDSVKKHITKIKLLKSLVQLRYLAKVRTGHIGFV